MESDEDEIIFLKVKDKTLKCSKKCLTSASDYFKAMFSGSFVESDQTTIELKDVEPETLKKVLCFLNSGYMNIFNGISSCLSVLQCASMLQFSKIEKLCEDYLLQELSFRNCLEIYETASDLNNLKVSEAALTFSMWGFEEVVKTEFFLNFSVQGIQDYLSKPELNLNSVGEWGVWMAIISWIQHDEEERSRHILSLLQCLDYSQLTFDDITNFMFYDVISSDSDSTKFLEAVKAVKKSSPVSEIMTEERTVDEKKILDLASRVALQGVPKRIFPSVPCLVCHRKRNSRDGGSYPVVYYYDEPQGKMVQLVQLIKLDPSYDMCVGFRVCAIGPSIYIMGGQYLIGGNKWNNDVWSYNAITNKWIPHTSLPRPRRSHVVCVLGSVIYLIGGYGKHRISLNTVDAYDVTSGSWIQCVAAPFQGYGAVCVFKKRILAFVNCILYTFYPERNMWIPSELNFSQRLSYCSAVAYKESVFLLASHSREIYKISPDSSLDVEYFGSFEHKTANVCLVAPRLVSFAKGTDESSREVNVVEYLYLDDENDGGKPEDRNKPPRMGEVVWMEHLGDEKASSQTTSCYNELPYGCFALFKLQRERLIS